MASTVWLHPRYWISRVHDSALLTRSSKYRVRRRYCHSVTGPSLCSEVLVNFFTGISLCYVSFRSSFFFLFRFWGRVWVHVGYVWLVVVQQESQRRENWLAAFCVHLQNLTPARNLVSHVHKGTVAVIFRGDCLKTNSSHEQRLDFDFFSFLFLIAYLSLKGDVSLIYSLGI